MPTAILTISLSNIQVNCGKLFVCTPSIFCVLLKTQRFGSWFYLPLQEKGGQTPNL